MCLALRAAYFFVSLPRNRYTLSQRNKFFVRRLESAAFQAAERLVNERCSSI
jgi:hypothetical protein